VPAAIREKPV